LKIWMGFVLTAAAVMLAVGTLPAGEDQGPAKMTLTGGSRGQVPFPHRLHQENLEDCRICHELFPQQQGAIDTLKSQGKLESKQVMNKLCTACHRDRRRAGEPSGPITCSDCHVRK